MAGEERSAISADDKQKGEEILAMLRGMEFQRIYHILDLVKVKVDSAQVRAHFDPVEG